MRLLLSLALALAFSRSLFADSPLHGTVADEGGAGIGQAMVLLHWNSAGSTVGLSSNVGIRRDVVLYTDNKGQFSVNLPPGFYDIFVTARAFSPTCQKIRTTERATLPALTFRLKVEPLYTNEMGFRIETVPPQKP